MALVKIRWPAQVRADDGGEKKRDNSRQTKPLGDPGASTS